jgi:uncharacterized damage-inducible protein DinB
MDITPILQRENDRIKDYLVRACSDLTDEQVNYDHEAIDERGINGMVVHMWDALETRARAVAGLEAQNLNHERPATLKELLAFVDEAHRRTAEVIAGITEEQLQRTVPIPPGRQMSGIEAMMQGYAHCCRHVGNLLDARHLGGFETHALG